MPARYAQLDGRHYVNADFIAGVRQAYPATTKKMPLGFATYTGWSGKDLVQFTQHQNIDELGDFGPVFEVTWEPSNPKAWEEDILGVVKHDTTQPKRNASMRQRVRPEAELSSIWGTTLDERIRAKKTAAERKRQQAKWREVVASIREDMARDAEERREASLDEDWISWES